MVDLCGDLHGLVWRLPRHGFPFEAESLPRNGIYALFERGEAGHGGDRIVRVGTHTGADQLPPRLTQHFVHEHKDRSIFRKNIGRALLCRAGDSFLEQWELDLTTRKTRERYAGSVDLERQLAVERDVTEYIQRNFTFAVFGVWDKAERLGLESACLSTVSLCETCAPSPAWLGNHSPKERIRESGLWNVNELYKTPLRIEQIRLLESLCG